jgi:putative ABC transport system permease protein
MMIRLRKLRGDLMQTWGRLVAMGLAIAVGVASLAAISSAYVILDRELNRGYLATHPPSATIEVDAVDEADLVAVRTSTGVAWAEMGGSVWGEVQLGPERTLPMLLFVVPAFERQRLNLLRLETGRWPKTNGHESDGIVLERVAMPLAQATTGTPLQVSLSGGAARILTVTGSVYDPTLAPANQQQTVYAYLAPQTLRFLGVDATVSLIKMAVTRPEDAAETERTAVAVATLLRDRGHRIGEVRVPPRQHPHWAMMQGVVRLLLVFSILTLGLSAVLTATLTSSLLASQIREIGVMKALGATDRQILGLYSLLIVGVAGAAMVLGLIIGGMGGCALARLSGSHLNVELARVTTPAWLWMAEAAAGIGLPLLGAWVPLRTAARRSVRESLDDHGVCAVVTHPGGSASWTLRVTARSPAVPLALRNAVRRRTRAALVLGLMTCAGALFLTSVNLSADWQRNLAMAMSERGADLTLQFAKPQPLSTVEAAARVPGVTWVEPFSVLRAVPARSDRLELSHAYADGEHGSVALHVVSPNSRFLANHVTQGRPLDDTDAPCVVLNQQALAQFPDARVGGSLELLLDGRAVALRIVGVIREHMAGATLYMTLSGYARATGNAGTARGLRLAVNPRLANPVIRSLNADGFTVVDSISRDQMARVIGGHLRLLIITLTILSLMMAAVGVLGIGAGVGMGVTERTREFAVMRVMGAGTGVVFATVMGEGLILGLASAGTAAVASVPLSVVVARVAGIGADGSTWGMLPSVGSIAIWLLIVLAAAALASLHPARAATRANLRLALDYR